MILNKILFFTTLILIAAIISFLVVNIFLKKNYSFKIVCAIFISLAILMALLSYFLKPCSEHDLYRYFEILEELKSKDFMFLIKDFNYNSAPLTSLWFFFVAKTGNFHLITTLPTLIVFLVFAFILVDIYKSKECKHFNHLCLTFLVVLSFIELIFILTTVRYYTAAAILLLALYRDIYKNKRNWLTIILYLIPVLIHNGIILIIFLRCLSVFNYKYFNILFLFSYLILWLVSKILVLINVNLLSKIGEWLLAYLGMEAIDFRFVACCTIFAVICIVLFSINTYIDHSKNKNTDENFGIKKYFNSENYKKHYVILNLAMTLMGLVFCSQLVRRLNLVTFFMFVPIILDSLINFDENKDMKILKIPVNVLKKIILVGFIVIIVGMFTYQAFGLKTWSLIWV